MKRSRELTIGVLAAIICWVASAKTEAQSVETPEQVVTVEQELETAQTCRVHYGSLNREAPCDSVGLVMLTELHIPTKARVIVRPTRTANYEQVGRMLQSLHSAGYLVEFPSR